jgi:ATP-dependent Clp protease protease subunit
MAGEVSRIETLAIDRTLNERGESMNRYWQLAVQDKEAALYIYGDIVTEDWKWLESDVSGHELVQQLDQLDVDLINVYINSYGGFVSEAWAIHNALKRQKAKIRTICEGFACSAASLIFMAGDERIMLDTSALWIHNVQTFAAGDYKKLQSEAEGAKKLNELGMQIYLEHVNLSEEELAAMMDKETWISPTEALEWGFATAIQSGGESKKPTQSARKHVFDMIFKEANRPLTAHGNVQVLFEERLEEFVKQLLAKLQAQANETEQEGPAPDQEHQDPESKGLFNFLEALASKLSEGDEEK